MKKMIFILLVCSLSGFVYAADEKAPSSKPLAVANGDKGSAVNLNALNHDIQDEDDNTFTPPAEDAENGRLSMNQAAPKDDDYN